MVKNFIYQPLLILMLAYIAGIFATLLINNIPSTPTMLIITLIVFGVTIYLSYLPYKKKLILICAATIGFTWMTFNINSHMAKSLPCSLAGQIIQVNGIVVSIPKYFKNENKLEFDFKIYSINKISNWRLPSVVRLTWYNFNQKINKNIKVGEQWQFTVKLKHPRGYANPGSFDLEKYYFQQRINAVGNIITHHANQPNQVNQVIKLDKASIFKQPINQLREKLANRITNLLSNHSFSGVILALALGMQHNISAEQWLVFKNTGTAHLIAISGLHIGLLASLVFLFTKIISKLLWRIYPKVPQPIISSYITLIITIIYAALAGFSIPTQRAIIMVAIFLISIIYRRKVIAVYNYLLAMTAVLTWDPFAILSTGFWLSFLAVGCLLIIYNSNRLQRQWLIFIGMLPVSVAFFGQFSMLAPLANFIAIPFISFITVPLILAGMLLIIINTTISKVIFLTAGKSLQILWLYLEKINNLNINYIITGLPPKIAIIIAIIGGLWIITPRGTPSRWWGILALLPLFFPKLNSIPTGQIEFTMLDIGQGLAAVIKTKNHVLIYDTGPKNNIIWPFLKAKGINKVNTLLISHADNDHIGGVDNLLQNITVDQVLINDINFLKKYNPIRCEVGQSWQWDGVKFDILHPPITNFTKTKSKRTDKRNNYSCVLRVTTFNSNQSLLLTGDIEAVSEKLLIQNFSEQLKSDVLIVPHHGSNTSSTMDFIKTVQPQYALISSGYLNRYGHPKSKVLSRYQTMDIPILITEKMGAITINLGGKNKKIFPKCYRIEHKAFWRDQTVNQQ